MDRGGQPNIRAMILAAGLGTRLKPWTDNHPKALALVNGKSLLQRNVEYLQAFGIRDIIVNVHHFADQIVSAISTNNGWGSNITISDETGAVLETGGGLKKAAWYLKSGVFVLMNVDVLTDLNLSAMLEQHEQTQSLATLATRERSTSRYLLFDDNGVLCGWRNVVSNEEKISRACNNCSQRAFSGMHVIDPGIFTLLAHEGKFSMIDVYLDLAKNHTISEFRDTSSAFIDVGRPESIVKAEALFH